MIHGISCIFDQLRDDQLMEDCGWVLDSAHDDLDQYQLGVTRNFINDRAPKANSNDMWGYLWKLIRYLHMQLM